MATTLHTQLLEQAKHLAHRERRRPKQASLRRAVSAAYYAVFHLVTDEGARLVVRGSKVTDQLATVARVFDHRQMKEVAGGFAQSNPCQPWRSQLGAVPPDIVIVADALVDLQHARHVADYDKRARFSRREVDEYVALAQEAFDAWRRLTKTRERDLFCLALLFGKVRY